MKDLTRDELRETNGGTDWAAIAAAVAEVIRQQEAIESLSQLTGTTDDIHN